MEKLSLNKIIEDLRENVGLAPQDLSRYRIFLAGEFGYLSAQLSQILMSKPALWNELRKEVKSDTAAERSWQATAQGLQETDLRLKLKTIEKLLSAIKTQIEINLTEARNII